MLHYIYISSLSYESKFTGKYDPQPPTHPHATPTPHPTHTQPSTHTHPYTYTPLYTHVNEQMKLSLHVKGLSEG